MGRIENRFIKDKPNKLIVILKGNSTQEKKGILLNRCNFLENNYCLYKTDKILIIERENEIQNLKKQYEDIKKINLYESLLTLDNKCVDIKSFKELISKKIEKDKIFIDNKAQEKIVSTLLYDFKLRFKRIKTLDRDIQFFVHEISFIKSSNINFDDYLCVDRKGRNIRKNSLVRKILYMIYMEYDKIIKKKNYYDYEDYLNHLEENILCKYSHVIVNHGEDFNVQEFKIINNIVNREIPYSSFIISINESLKIKLKEVTKEKYKTIKLKSKVNLKNKVKNKETNMEKFKYIDFRHKIEYNFEKDYLNDEELFLANDGFSEIINKNELKDIVIYNDIAAGEPILMVDENEGLFKLPNYLFKGIDKCFMLKVKGDSMINANIDDGDYVIIRQQFLANSGEIVAAELDESATLKRFVINKNTPYLMAENPKYSPINLKEREGSILGIAIGLVKKI